MSENVLRPGASRYAFSTEAHVTRCIVNFGTHLSGPGLRGLTIAIGGDSTLLRAAHMVAGRSIL
jgi:NAD kinase